MNEDFRRNANAVIVWASWLGALSVAAWEIGDPDNRRQYGILVVLLIGIGITASLIRVRYKLAETISEVFQAGMRAGWNTPKRKYYVNEETGETIEVTQVPPSTSEENGES